MVDEIVKNTVEAIAKGRTDVILTLIETYGKASPTNNGSESVALKILLDSLVTESGTFLHYATRLNQTDIARALLLAGSDPSATNGQQKSCWDLAETTEMQIVYLHELMRVIALSCVSKVAQMLGSGFDVNCQKLIISGDTPLHWAATYADFNTLCFLLDKGGNPNAVNCYGATPLHDAIVRGDPEIVEELLRHGANPNIKPKSGKYLEKFKSNSMVDSDSVLFPIRDDESDLERISDSSSSWINAGGSHDSLTVACPTEIVQPLESRDDKRDVALMTDYQSNVPSLATPVSNETSHSYSNEFAAKFRLVWPRPKVLHLLKGDGFTYSKELAVYLVESHASSDETLASKVVSVWETHSKALLKVDLSYRYMGVWSRAQSTQAVVLCHINAHVFSGAKEAFTITVTSSLIKIVSSDERGFYYAVSFLIKYIELFADNRTIPPIKVSDWPKWKFRGWMIDTTSTKPTPKFEMICRDIDVASSFRYNHVLLHTTLSHSFRIDDQDCLTPQDILNLEKFCDEKCCTLTPSIELFPNSNHLDDDEIIRSIRSYLDRFSKHGYVYIGPNLTRHLLQKANFDWIHLFKWSCLIFDSCLLDANLQWFDRVPLNAVLLTSSKHFDLEFYYVQRRLSQLGCVLNAAVPCVLENSITGCSNLLLERTHEVARFGQSIENVVFIMSGVQKPSEYHLLRTFYLPAMAFGGGIAWNPDFKADDIEKYISSIIDFHVFANNQERLGEVMMELCQVESNLRSNCSTDTLPVLYELISNPDNVSLDYLNAERIHKAVRDLKQSLSQLVVANVKDPFARIALEEIQLVADIMLFSLRLCRHLLCAGQNPSSKGVHSTAQLAVINVGISNLPPPIRTDLANKLLELMRRFRSVNLQSHMSRGLEQEGQPFYVIFQQLIINNLSSDILDV